MITEKIDILAELNRYILDLAHTAGLLDEDGEPNHARRARELVHNLNVQVEAVNYLLDQADPLIERTGVISYDGDD